MIVNEVKTLLGSSPKYTSNSAAFLVKTFSFFSFLFLFLCRQARLDKEAAESLAAANANKPVWRPKPKKRRRKNQKDW